MLGKLKKLSTNATASAAQKTAIIARRTAVLLPEGLIENQVDAPASRGESVLSQNSFGITDNDSILNPLQVLTRGIKSLYKNSKTVFKSKRRLIPALALALIWVLLIPLHLLGVNWVPVNILSFLTFAKGGLSPNLFHTIGGVIGKGVVAGLVLPFFTGQNPLQISVSGMKQVRNLIWSRRPTDMTALLSGTGAALIAYNFMAGQTSLEMSMAAVAGFVLSLRALGKQTGFLKSLVFSVVAKIRRDKRVDSDFVKRVVAGMSMGFALAIPLSTADISMAGYLVGGIVLIAGILTGIFSARSKEAEV